MASRIVAQLSTIRARTTAAACAVVACALVVGMLLVLFVLRRALEDNVEDAARVRAREVAGLVQSGELPATLAVPVADEAVVQVVDGGGAVIAASANVIGSAPISDLRPEPGRTEVRDADRLPIEDEAGDPFRIVAFGAEGVSESITVYVAASLEPVNESVAAVRTILLIGLPVLLVIVAGTSWYVVGRALRPVDAIRQEVQDISARDLGRRVPLPRTDDEIGRLASGMNEMLDRLEFSSERQRRFVADASHELQSPLASSLAQLEVALAHPDATEWPDTASALVEDNRRMTKLVQDLLFLARSDGATADHVRAAIDLDDVVRAEVTRLRPRASVVVDGTAVSPVEVRADADQIARVVRNLLENANRYARTRIAVELAERDDAAILVVADDGPGVPAEDRERVFERFTRLDDSRSRETGGVGLGLAIAREIVELRGGSIAIESVAGGGARFVVRLPVDGRGAPRST
ncbi:MAG: sensor histidine kinase [Acidimicrobiia bacterium]